MSHNTNLTDQNASFNTQTQAVIIQEEESTSETQDNIENNVIDYEERSLNLLMAPNGSEFVVVQEVEVSSGDLVVGEHCLANNIQIIDASSTIVDENGHRIIPICNSADNMPIIYTYGEISGGIQYIATEEAQNLVATDSDEQINHSETEIPTESLVQQTTENQNLVDVSCFLNLPLTKSNDAEDDNEITRKKIELKIESVNDQETVSSVANLLASSQEVQPISKLDSTKDSKVEESVAQENYVAKELETSTDELENEIRRMERTMKMDDETEDVDENKDMDVVDKNAITGAHDGDGNTDIVEDDSMEIEEKVHNTIQERIAVDSNTANETETQHEKQAGPSIQLDDLASEKPTLPRFLQVDAKLIQEALRSKPSSETGDKSNSINPVFKICKMARKADGTVECVPMNMRDLNLGDRQRVYSAMLEKFPEIVKRQAASVLTPYQLNKLDSKLPPELKLRRRRRKKMNNEGNLSLDVNSDAKETLITDHIENFSSEIEMKQNKSSVQICFPSSMEQTEQTSTLIAEHKETSVADETDQIVEETTPSSFISRLSESACNDDIEVAEEVETSGGTDVSMEKKVLGNSTLEIPNESEQMNADEAITSVTKSASVIETSNVGNSVVIKKYVSLLRPQFKKTVVVPTPPHSCNKIQPINCSACDVDFESLFLYEEHCLLTHMQAVPHFFAVNSQYHCLLCKTMIKTEEAESSSEALPVICHTLKEAREHFRQHCIAQSPQCEMCKRLVQRDHMYAAPQDNEERMLIDHTADEMIDVSEKQEGNDSTEISTPILESILKENIKPENNNQSNSVPQMTKPSEINRILRRFDKEHHQNQMLRTKGTLRKLYRCRYCEKEFQRRTIWKMHVLAHLGHHPILCPLCGMSFHRKYSLSLHMQVHLMSKPKENIIDDPEDVTKQKLQHVRKRIVKKKFAKIEKKVNDDDEANDSAQSDENKEASAKSPLEKGPVLCEVCGRELKNRRQLLQHQYRVHNYPRKRPNNKNVTPTPCPDCGKVCRGPSALKHHQRQVCGVKEVLCEICGKVYPAGGRALSNHKYQVHKWQGSELEKMAIEKRKLRQSEEEINSNNSGEQDEGSQSSDKTTPKGRQKVLHKLFKPEVCELCGFVAKYSTSMRSHLVNKHKFPKKRTRACNSEPVACAKCGTVCKGPGALKLHEKRFCLQSRNLICPVCGKTCSTRKNLSRHKYNHKWWGTDKEKAWREKRRLLGLPIRKKRPKPETEFATADVVADDGSFQLVMNLPIENTEEVETAPTEEVTTEESYFDATSLLQVIHAANQAAGINSGIPQTVHLQLPANTTLAGNMLANTNILENKTTEEIIEETEVVQENNIIVDGSSSPKVVNVIPAYHLLLTDENGRPVYAYVPDTNNT